MGFRTSLVCRILRSCKREAGVVIPVAFFLCIVFGLFFGLNSCLSNLTVTAGQLRAHWDNIDAETFQARTKQTGNPSELTFREWKLLKEAELLPAKEGD